MPTSSMSELTANNGHEKSSLHAATWAGNLADVKHLIESGADVNWRDSIEETRLFGACAWKSHQDVKYL